MATVFYSLLHMLVDGVCAVSMYGWFATGGEGYLNILIYNFCAFALQMPLGALLDLLEAQSWPVAQEQLVDESCGKRSHDWTLVYVFLGVILTFFGTFMSPLILGVGNALFHVGGGVAVIHEDEKRKRKGQELGFFVAPGAFGLFLGSLIAGKSDVICRMSILLSGLCMAVFIILLYYGKKSHRRREETLLRSHETVYMDFKSAALGIGCFLVVILRSFVGMTVSFPWKTTIFMALLNVLAVVAGKMVGGVLAAKKGLRSTITYTLILAAVCYLFSEYVVFGIAAQFFFNMTMPITLYLLVSRFERLPGFSFGLLTFGLFLGFLPVYMDVTLPVSSNVIGVVGSFLSLGILLIAGEVDKHGCASV